MGKWGGGGGCKNSHKLLRWCHLVNIKFLPDDHIKDGTKKIFKSNAFGYFARPTCVSVGRYCKGPPFRPLPLNAVVISIEITMY